LKCPKNDVGGMRDIVKSLELGALEKVAVFKSADHQIILDRNASVGGGDGDCRVSAII
jgi:hypothetical protein